MTSKEWHKESTLERLYHVEKMSQPEIADHFNVARTTIQYWMEKHEIERRSDAEGQKLTVKEQGPKIHMDNDGHEMFTVEIDQVVNSVYHHRLLALLKYEPEEIRGKVVHHRDHIQWDNRIENLELMSKSDHMAHHHAVNRGEKEIPTP